VCKTKKNAEGKEAAPPTIYPACEPKPPSPAPTEFNKAERKTFSQKNFFSEKLFLHQSSTKPKKNFFSNLVFG